MICGTPSKMPKRSAMGKFYFFHFGKFLIKVHPTSIQRCYTSACSTNPKGDAQPGNFVIVLTDECRELRQNTTKRISKHQRRVADYTIYDKRNEMYSIVGEIKSDESDAENQNFEQMVGKNQQAMLGFTCNKEAIIPGILIQQPQGTLALHTLQTLSLDEENYSVSIRQLAQLFIAFTGIVNIAF